MLKEGNLEDWRLKMLEEEEKPWYEKQSNEEFVELLVLRVKSPGDLCVMPKNLREEVGKIQQEVSQSRGASLTSLYLGQLVAAPRKTEGWGRAKVVEIKEKRVKVFFVDLGEQRSVREEDLRELTQDLARKPPTILRTGLVNISPPSKGNLHNVHEIHSHIHVSCMLGVWSKETCRRLKTLVQDAMDYKGGSIQGKLVQVGSLSWPLLDLKATDYRYQVVHINAVLEERGDQDLSSSSLTNLSNVTDGNSNKGPAVEGVTEVSKFVTSTNAGSRGRKDAAPRSNLSPLTGELDKMLGLVEQIKQTAWQRLREGERGHRLAVAVLQHCLSSLELPQESAALTEVTTWKDADSGGWVPVEANMAPLVLQERQVSKPPKPERAKTDVEVTHCNLKSGERDEKVKIHLLRFEPGGERWCSSKELSYLLPHWGGRDLVNKMLKVKRIEMVEKLIKKQEQPKVFATLAEWGVRGVNIGEEELVFYRLQDLPVIMKAFRLNGLKEVLVELENIIKGD